ncbi:MULTISPECIES: hypothetical protein [Sphingomonas]|uniref:hypothetical protein n=1 Tax=Sphingomonas TaxID=13687 RepID=UPI001269D291|nr:MULTISPECIES: hypothetical protein [Sphingomonas]
MGDGFDWHLPLFALLAVAAIYPALQVWRFVQTLRMPRDVTQPPLPPLTPIERKRLLLCVAALPLLGCAAILVALAPHPVAAFPLIVGSLFGLAISLLTGFRVLSALRTGTAVVKSRGWSGTYDRAAQPAHFWLANAFNGFAGLFFAFLFVIMVLAVTNPVAAPPESCFEPDSVALRHCSVITHQREMRTLSKQLATNPDDSEALEKRARLYESTDDLVDARADWDRLRVIRNREGRPLTGS